MDRTLSTKAGSHAICPSDLFTCLQALVTVPGNLVTRLSSHPSLLSAVTQEGGSQHRGRGLI